mmetsp:Transcript_21622/g.52987  ORF Transcript_21622/g.52987 Transcript_21622/m.52987 type:complete len:111 (-) Transcript_21622:470-802(-)
MERERDRQATTQVYCIPSSHPTNQINRIPSHLHSVFCWQVFSIVTSYECLRISNTQHMVPSCCCDRTLSAGHHSDDSGHSATCCGAAATCSLVAWWWGPEWWTAGGADTR